VGRASWSSLSCSCRVRPFAGAETSSARPRSRLAAHRGGGEDPLQGPSARWIDTSPARAAGRRAVRAPRAAPPCHRLLGTQGCEGGRGGDLTPPRGSAGSVLERLAQLPTAPHCVNGVPLVDRQPDHAELGWSPCATAAADGQALHERRQRPTARARRRRPPPWPTAARRAARPARHGSASSRGPRPGVAVGHR
jgi:hypothetical protein